MNPARCGFNGRVILSACVAVLIGLTAWCAPSGAAGTSASDRVFDIRLPPQGALSGGILPEAPHSEIPPGFWARHGRPIMVWAVAMLLLCILCRRVLRRPYALVQPTPGTVALRALHALETSRQEDAGVLGEVCRILKQYAAGARALPPRERTTTDLNEALWANVSASDAWAAELIVFLQSCDAHRFGLSASDQPFGAVARALSLVRSMEALNERMPMDSDEAAERTAA